MERTRLASLSVALLLGVALGLGATNLLRGHPEEHSVPAHEPEEHPEEHSKAVSLSETARKAAGIEVEEARGGLLEEVFTLPGEVTYDADRIAHIVPRVGGIARAVHKKLGDEVQPGDVLAVLESRELAEAKAAFLASQQRLSLARAAYASAEELHQKGIMPDLEFLTAKKALTEGEIEVKASQNRLHAIGLTKPEIDAISQGEDLLSLYELRAPFAGTVVEKHITLGEVVDDKTDTFLLADLSTVWADIKVYSQDLGRVFVGQKVEVRIEGFEGVHQGEISYLSPAVSETTRTATARLVLPNDPPCCRPGAFLTASLVVRAEPVDLLLPLDAIQRVDGRSVVFVVEGETFEPRPVTLGRQTATHAQVLSGLEPGTRYVAKGAFVLKSELGKGEAEHEH